MSEAMWRTIKGYSAYSVSDAGFVRRDAARGDGHSPGVLRGSVFRTGYCYVELVGDDGVKKKHLIHRLVAAAFVDGDGDGRQVNHKDGDKGNNRADNLEYVTPRQNMRHSVDVLRRQHGIPKLTEALVRQIREMAADGIRDDEIARRIGVVGHFGVAKARRRDTWKHVA